MMRPSRPLIQSIVFIVGGVYFVAYLVQGLPTDDLLKPLGFAGAAAALAVLAFDHVIWRLPKVGFSISGRPDVRGTWKGVLTSHWEDPETGERKDPFEVYLAVEQTFWSVSAALITEESKSCSTLALIEDDGCGQTQLVAMYRNTPRAAVRHRSEVHHGSFKLDLSGRPTNRLEGYYWTDRNTMGEFEFSQRSKHLAGSFTEAQSIHQ